MSSKTIKLAKAVVLNNLNKKEGLEEGTSRQTLTILQPTKAQYDMFIILSAETRPAYAIVYFAQLTEQDAMLLAPQDINNILMTSLEFLYEFSGA